MNFLEELAWRGMLQDHSPGVEEVLNKGVATGYIGFDPTAPAITIGNFVQIQLLTLFQRCGHRPIILMGGATGRVGDPSGKDKERQLKSFEELDTNLQNQMRAMKQFLNFDEGPNKAMIVNNLDFYQEMNVLDFLRDVGKTLTVNYMMNKESVKRRIETGISFTEFSYQLLQGYDFQCLYQSHNCVIQMGGSDQWGNITSGTEFVRRNLGGKAYGITTPLLTKADGSKFGKSEEGNIWINADLTSPYAFYQFWVRASDADLPKYMRYFTLKSKEEVEAMEQEHADDPNSLKALLAEEMTVRIHGTKAFEAAQQVSTLLFRKMNAENLKALDESTLDMVAKEIPTFELPLALLGSGLALTPLLAEHTDIFSSNGEVRRAVKNNAIGVNKVKMKSHDEVVDSAQLLQGKYLFVENGKRNKYLIKAI